MSRALVALLHSRSLTHTPLCLSVSHPCRRLLPDTVGLPPLLGLQGSGPPGEAAAAAPLACPDVPDMLLQDDVPAADDLGLLLEELAGGGDEHWAAPGADAGHLLVSPRSPGQPWAF